MACAMERGRYLVADFFSSAYDAALISCAFYIMCFTMIHEYPSHVLLVRCDGSI